MFGLIGSLIGWLSYHLGIRGTDTASATGSLHGKVMDVKAALGTSGDNRASNTVMGWQSTQIKSWQRVTGTSSGTNDLSLTLSSVTASKCIVLVDGCQYAYDAYPTVGWVVPVHRYVSAFSSTSITLKVSATPRGSTVHGDDAFSVIVVEFY